MITSLYKNAFPFLSLLAFAQADTAEDWMQNAVDLALVSSMGSLVAYYDKVHALDKLKPFTRSKPLPWLREIDGNARQAQT